MLFSSLTFLFIFLPITLILYYIIPKKYVNIKNVVLLIMSLLFYSWGEPKYIILMLISIIINYLFGIIINRNLKYKKIIFVFSLIVNIGLLFYFKYFNFVLDSVNALLNTNIKPINILLPIGISFYTFQILSYIIDVYRGNVKVQKNILNLATYIALFPQLIAGPIVRYETIEEQLNKRNESISNFGYGLRRFIIGLGKKVIIANNIAIFADTIFNNPNGNFGTLVIWLAVLAYTLQIYFDFSGYSDMAIGLGKMFGFEFLENFNYPYISKSITEFWRRWHISLSTWFKDYVYIPLGGNRKGKLRWSINLLVVWLLTGLWHGASWNFVIWGIYYGIILIVEKLFLSKYLAKSKVLSYLYSIILIMIGWLIFRIENISLVLSYLKIMFIFQASDISLLFLNYQDLIPTFIYLLLGVVGCGPWLYNGYKKIVNSNKIVWQFLLDIVIFIIFVISVLYLVSSKYNPFIYFRF